MHPRLRVADQAARRLDRPQVQEGIRGPDRIVEELAPVHDPGQARHRPDLLAKDLAPERLDLGTLGEKPVRADIKAAAHELKDAGDAAHPSRDLLVYRRRRPLPGPLLAG